MKRNALLMLVVATTATLVAGLAPVQATPMAPQENVRHVENLPGTTGGHVVIQGNRLYMGNYGIGMSIYDISDPSNPVQIGQYRPAGLRADANPDASSWDGREIAVLSGDRVTGVTDLSDFLDVTDAANPRLLYTVSGSQGGSAHTGDIVDARKLWLPNNPSGFPIYDVSPVLQEPPQAPVLLSNATLRTLWLNSPYRRGRAVGPAPAGGYHDITVYTDLRVLLDQNQWVDEDGDGTADPTYGPRDIAFAAEAGSLNLLPGPDPTGSVYVVDITDPRNPVVRLRWVNNTGHEAFYYHEAQLLDGDPHVMVVSDEELHSGCDNGGLYTVRLADDYTQATKLAEWFIGSGTPAGVCSTHVFSSHGAYVFVGSYNAGLQVVDLTDPAAPKRAGQYIAEGANSWGATYHDGYVYVGDWGGRGLDVFEFIPNPVRKGLIKAPNPASRTLFGVTEQGCGVVEPEGPTNTVDGLVVPIPEAMADGTHTIRATGSADAPYDLDIWFYDQDCGYLPGTGIARDGTDDKGPIPKGAGFAIVTLYTGGPTWTYAQFDA